MTTIDLYRKHKTGDISREKFLYEVRRDEQLPWITNLTSYDDAVKILKNKGVVTEAKVEEPAKPKTKKSSKTLTIDYVNPYQFRHGLVYELEQLGDISDESLAKAKEKVLKNLTKDPTFYSTLLNQKQSPYEFKAPETDAPGMQANADGTLKKGAGKLEKANVKDNLGKKEAGKAKPKGVKVMPDKGVEGTQKTIKEGSDLTLTKKVKESKHIKLKEAEGDTTYSSQDLIQTLTPKIEKDVEVLKKQFPKYNISLDKNRYESDDSYTLSISGKNTSDIDNEKLEKIVTSKIKDTIVEDKDKKSNIQKLIDAGYSESDAEDLADEFEQGGVKVPQKVKDILKEINTDGLKQMGYSDSDIEDFMDEWKQGGSKLPEKVKDYLDGLYNTILGQLKTKPLREVKIDKHAKLKELLKTKLKETLSVADIQAAKKTGKPINVSKTNTQDIKALQTAKANFSTYE
jgi:hypothetical protein